MVWLRKVLRASGDVEVDVRWCGRLKVDGRWQLEVAGDGSWRWKEVQWWMEPAALVCDEVGAKRVSSLFFIDKTDVCSGRSCRSENLGTERLKPNTV